MILNEAILRNPGKDLYKMARTDDALNPENDLSSTFIEGDKNLSSNVESRAGLFLPADEAAAPKLHSSYRQRQRMWRTMRRRVKATG